MILLQIVMVSPGTHFVKNHESSADQCHMPGGLRYTTHASDVIFKLSADQLFVFN